MATKTLKKRNATKTATIFFFLLLITFLFPPYQNNTITYQEGTIWTEPDLIAPFSFPLYKSQQEYDLEKKKAKENALPVFNKVSQEFSLRSYMNFFQTLYKNLGAIINEDLKTDTLENLDIAKNEQEKNLLIDDYKQLIASRGKKNSFLKLLEDNLSSIIMRFNSENITNHPKHLMTNSLIRVLENDKEKIVNIDNIKEVKTILEDAKRAITSIFLPYYSKDTATVLANIGATIASRFILPSLLFDNKKTMISIEEINKTIPMASGLVKKNEVIVLKDQIITKDASKRLASFNKARLEMGTSSMQAKIYIGRLLIVATICTVFWLSLLAFSELRLDNKKLLFVTICVLAPIALTWLATYLWQIPPYIIPAGLFAILLTIIFNPQIGLISTFSIAMFSALVRGSDFAFAISIIVAGCATLLTIKSLRTRSWFIIVTPVTFIGYGVVITAFGLLNLSDPNTILNNILYAAVGALGNLLAYPLLIATERFFGITTDFTLVELSSLNHPLLKNLSKTATGTYHHSIQVGFLAEEIASTVNANALLCRVGAYFHDIGKMEEPEFFMENQKDKNPHEFLSASESARHIIAHVKNGQDLAKIHRLPSSITDFILQHHGTSMVTYFYEKAKETLPPERLNIEHYKYQGEKPKTKESAIVMIVDGVEAAIRSITIFSEPTIRETVTTIIEQRVKEDQFSDCNITFSELKTIKENLISLILNSQHLRVKYPNQII